MPDAEHVTVVPKLSVLPSYCTILYFVFSCNYFQFLLTAMCSIIHEVVTDWF